MGIKLDFLPKDFSMSMSFVGSSFQNLEAETVAKNIVFIQNKINPEAWTPFSFQDYKKHCTHEVTLDERGVLNALAEGGRPVCNTTTILDPGYLIKEGEFYKITDKFIQVCVKLKNKPY